MPDAKAGPSRGGEVAPAGGSEVCTWGSIRRWEEEKMNLTFRWGLRLWALDSNSFRTNSGSSPQQFCDLEK